jgi:hypothetical protein
MAMSQDFAGFAEFFAKSPRRMDETAYYRASAPRPLSLHRAAPVLAIIGVVICVALGGLII